MTAALPRRIRRTSSGAALPRVDGRLRSSRRFRDLVERLSADLGSGNLTEADQALVAQAANLVLAGERLQADVIAGAQVDPDTLVRVSSEARRALDNIATRAAKAKPAPPTSLHELLAREDHRA